MKLVMFDMDGTLYRSDTSFFPAVHEFAEKYGIPQPDIDFLRGFIGKTGEEWRAWLDSLHLSRSTDELEQEFSALERRYVEAQGQLYPHAPAVLQQLKDGGWELGICSNAPAWYPEVILTRAHVRELFSLIHVPRRSGETKAVMLCETWNELHPEICAMVGDRADDMQAARAGGFLAIGAAYGWAPEELEHADVRVDDVGQVPEVLRRHFQQAPAAGSVSTAEGKMPEPAVAVAAVPQESSTGSSPVPLPAASQPISPAGEQPPAGSSRPPAPSMPEPVPVQTTVRHGWNPFRRRGK